MPFVPRNPTPPSGTVEDAKLIPEATAGWWSLLTFSWITPLLALGYARPLEATDLYKLQDKRSAGLIATRIDESFTRRQKAAKEYNARLAAGEISPGLRRVWWTVRGKRAEREKRWREVDGKKKASLAYAINDSIKFWFWSGAAIKLVGDTATILTPLVVKVRNIVGVHTLVYSRHVVRSQALITFAQNSYS